MTRAMHLASQPLIVALAISAAAGTASFLSPCVAPLVPGYLAFLAGDSPASSHATAPSPLARASAFVTGFAIVFTLLGLGASSIGRLLDHHRLTIELVGGFCITLLGLAMVFGRTIMPSSAARSAGTLTTRLRRPVSLAGAALIGMAFSVAWTPCIGPALAAILLLAGNEPSPARGAGLLFAYSLGLGIPFLLAALGVQRFQHHTRVLLMVVGISIATGRFGDLTAQLARRVPDWLP